MTAALTDILMVLVLGSALGWLSLRLGFPNAVAQVVLGVLLGTAVLGWVPHSSSLHTIGEVGVVLLLGVAGLELGINRLTAAGWAGALVAMLGIVLGVVSGYAVASVYGSPVDEALYVGLVLGATSIGITAQVLKQFGLMAHRVADVLLAAAVIDDVIALYLLGAAHGFLSDESNGSGALFFAASAIIVLGGLLLVSRSLTRWAFQRGFIGNRWSRGAWILAAVALGAWLTHSLGLSSVVGAFFVGLGTGEGLSDEVSKRSARDLQPLVRLLMPFFFVMIGVQAQWNILDEPALLGLVLSLIVFALISKIAGGVLGAVQVNAWRDRWLIGFGMVPRGEVALVIATLAFEQGHMSRPVFVALVLMTITVAVTGPLLMAPLAKRLGAELSAGG